MLPAAAKYKRAAGASTRLGGVAMSEKVDVVVIGMGPGGEMRPAGWRRPG